MPQVDEIYYESHGSGPGEPAVLIMGLAMDANGWERQLPALAAHRRVIVLDNRGVGRSKKPPGPYTTAAMADDVIAVMDEVGLATAHIVGVSLGGAIAQELTLRHAARVRSLALLCTFARVSRGMTAIADTGGATLGGEGGVAMDPRSIYRFLMPMVFTADFLQREKALLKQMLDRSMSYGFEPHGVFAQLAAAMSHDTVARLGEIAVPTLIVTGTADMLVPPKQSKRLAEGIPGAKLVEIEGAPHGIVLERGDEMSAILTGWLKDHDPKAA
jgi:3-oxoadipate enol-lactonase